MDFFTRYAPPKSPSVQFVAPSMTDRSFKDECDINKLVARCMQTGFPEASVNAMYADLADMPNDLQSAMEFMETAETHFAGLPSELRREFGNNALAFLQGLHDPSKQELFERHGVFKSSQVVHPVSQESVSVDNAAKVSSQETDVAKS